MVRHLSVIQSLHFQQPIEWFCLTNHEYKTTFTVVTAENNDFQSLAHYSKVSIFLTTQNETPCTSAV